MKITTSLSLSILLIVVVFISCSKNNDSAPTPNPPTPPITDTPIAAAFDIVLSDSVAPTQVEVQNKTTGATSYEWSFSTGAPTTSSLKDPGKIIFDAPGTHTIQLKATNSTRSRTISKSFTLKQKSSSPETYPYYFKGTFGNQTFNYFVRNNFADTIYDRISESSSWYINGVFYDFNAEGSIIYDGGSGSFAGRVYLVDSIPDPSQPEQMFHLGRYGFGNHFQNSANNLQNDGAIIWLTDKNGKHWYSELGPNPSTESSFEVIRLDTWDKDNAKKIWKVKVSCNLYDRMGNKSRLQDAELQGHILRKP